MRRFGLFAALLLLAGVLAACTITVTYTPPPSATTISATGSSLTVHPSALDTVSVPAGGTVYYKIDVPSGVQNGYPVLYAELSKNLNLELMDSSGRPIASAHNNNYFASDTAGLASLTSASVAPSDISVLALACRGSCVIVPLKSAVYYVAITNKSSSQVTTDVYAYGSAYDDTEEPGNNSYQTTAATLGTSGTHDGALETLGDVDYWYTSSAGYWSFYAPSPDITIVAQVVDSTGAPVSGYGPYYDGDQVHVLGGNYVEVYALYGRAGAADPSYYSFSGYTP